MFISRLMASILAVFLFLLQPSAAQEITAEDYAKAEGFLSQYTSPLIFKATVSPNWISDSRMWYRNTIAEGSEFILVDAERGTREHAFDHARLARAASAASDSTYSEYELPFRTFEFTGDDQITFSGDGLSFTCDIARYQCTAEEASRGDGRASAFSGFARFRSTTVPSPDGAKEAFIREKDRKSVV